MLKLTQCYYHHMQESLLVPSNSDNASLPTLDPAISGNLQVQWLSEINRTVE